MEEEYKDLLDETIDIQKKVEKPRKANEDYAKLMVGPIINPLVTKGDKLYTKHRTHVL